MKSCLTFSTVSNDTFNLFLRLRIAARVGPVFTHSEASKASCLHLVALSQCLGHLGKEDIYDLLSFQEGKVITGRKDTGQVAFFYVEKQRKKMPNSKPQHIVLIEGETSLIRFLAIQMFELPTPDCIEHRPHSPPFWPGRSWFGAVSVSEQPDGMSSGDTCLLFSLL